MLGLGVLAKTSPAGSRLRASPSDRVRLVVFGVVIALVYTRVDSLPR